MNNEHSTQYRRLQVFYASALPIFKNVVANPDPNVVTTAEFRLDDSIHYLGIGVIASLCALWDRMINDINNQDGKLRVTHPASFVADLLGWIDKKINGPQIKHKKRYLNNPVIIELFHVRNAFLHSHGFKWYESQCRKYGITPRVDRRHDGDELYLKEDIISTLLIGFENAMNKPPFS